VKTPLLSGLPSGVFSARQQAVRAICYRPSICLSVRPSVTRVDQSKMVEVRIMDEATVFCRISFIQKFRRDPPSGGVKQWCVAALRETSYFRSSNAFARWLPKLDILSQLLQTYSPGGGNVAR